MPAQGHRLYVKAKHLSYQRSKHHIQPNTSLVKVEGCDSKEDAQFYLGKRICFVYKCNKPIRGSKIRVIWGTIARAHGNSGVVRARFVHNLPPKTFGASLRVMLYPSNI